MSYYLNAECPCCNETILTEHEMVVCPECGTPHHRACYFERGDCFNSSLHSEGFEWKAKELENRNETAGAATECEICSGKIAAGSAFCNYCGAPAGRNTKEAYGHYQQPRDSIFFSEQARSYDQSEKIDDIPVKDWMTYIGANHHYYIYHFKLQDRTNRKTAFTLSAVIFPFLYFLYRRVWWAAAVSGITNILLSIPLIVASLTPFGINFGMSAASLERVSGICNILLFGINMCWGLFAVWFYRRKAAAYITRMRDESHSPMDFDGKLLRAAGPSKLAVILVGAVFFGIGFISALAGSLNIFV